MNSTHCNASIVRGHCDYVHGKHLLCVEDIHSAIVVVLQSTTTLDGQPNERHSAGHHAHRHEFLSYQQLDTYQDP